MCKCKLKLALYFSFNLKVHVLLKTQCIHMLTGAVFALFFF